MFEGFSQRDQLNALLLYAQVAGVKHCLGVDALNTAANAMTRFVAPVTLLATGGAGQVLSWACCLVLFTAVDALLLDVPLDVLTLWGTILDSAACK